MSKHEGVSCDSCLKQNFRGKRYKCLVCYDYDLCENCYESSNFSSNRNSTSSNGVNHNGDHAMQCILTQLAYDLFYSGGDSNSYTIQSITCPICGSMGFTEATLIHHVSQNHSSHSQEVVCPLCATAPNGDPNCLTEDYARHLTRFHSSSSSRAAAASTNTTSVAVAPVQPTPVDDDRNGTNETIFPGSGAIVGAIVNSRSRGRPSSNSTAGVFHSGRAILRRRNGGVLNLTSSSSGATSAGVGTGMSATATSTNGGGVAANGNGAQTHNQTTNMSATIRDAVVDPIAELLSQLSGVRRGGAVGGRGAAAAAAAAAEHHAVLSSTANHLQQLQWQIGLERQNVNAARDHLSRIPRRSYGASSYSAQSSVNHPLGASALLGPDPTQLLANAGSATNSQTTPSTASSHSTHTHTTSPLFATDILHDSRFLLRNYGVTEDTNQQETECKDIDGATNATTTCTAADDDQTKATSVETVRDRTGFVQDLTYSLLHFTISTDDESNTNSSPYLEIDRLLHGNSDSAAVDNSEGSTKDNGANIKRS